MSDARIGESESMASRGGRASAAKMTPEQRSERARKAAENRSLKNAPRATYSGLLNLAGHTIACAVLEDGRRLLSTVSFTQAIGRTGKIQTATVPENGISFKAPPFLLADNLKPFVDKHLESPQANPLIYKPLQGGFAYGYEAKLLPVVCRIYLDAQRAKVLTSKQKHIADACELLLSALASVGIDALVDEATGFQYNRTRDALQNYSSNTSAANWPDGSGPSSRTSIDPLPAQELGLQGGSSKRTPHVAS